MTESNARIRLNTNKTRRAGDNFFSIPAKSAATILNGCFQAVCECTACQSTSRLYRLELAWASALNCVQRSSASMPAVSWRQPSLERHSARLALVLELCAKFWILAQLEPVVPRGSLVTRVATLPPNALPERRADQVFQVFLNGDGPVRRHRGFPGLSAGPQTLYIFAVAISSRTFRNHEKNRGARIRPNL